KKNKLQDAVNRRMINADEKLRALFGTAQVSMFELAKLVSKYVK
ncbi:MAG TPA: SWIB/MDM2 domain-containing protein, partial [Polyangia bacterium]|nr:SWIB/MDM2 domain-containing protein [Polyangia bacterium]